MFSDRLFQQKSQELRSQLDLLHHKILKLRENCAIQAGTSNLFQVEYELEQAEARREQIERELQNLERRRMSDRIHHELSRLNYKSQAQLFSQFLDEQRIGAFLVHGQSEYGQVFLVKRFLRGLPNSIATSPVQIHLKRRANRTDVQALWRELGREMRLEDLSNCQEIARQVIAQLQTQHVILVFHDLDYIDEEYLAELTNDFWLPLAELAHCSLSNDHEFYLLMFLLDQEGCVGTWDLQFAEQFDNEWNPRIPLRMPPIEPLSDQVLLSWMENAIDALPAQITKKMDFSVQMILEQTGGVPEQVFAQIFSVCGCRWQEEEVRWLNL
jgi:hypothetical protein